MFINDINLDAIPGAIGFKDQASNYCAGNTELARYMGYSMADAIVGKSDDDIRADTVELAEQYRQQDQVVMRSGRQQHLDIGYYQNQGLQVHLSTKQPWRDISGALLGTVFTCIEIKAELMQHIFEDIFSKRQPRFYQIGGLYDSLGLSKRESQCLFFLIRGNSAKDIAKRYHLSPKTIEYYIDKLKQKFNCLNKSHLIESAINMGFIMNIPNEIVGAVDV